MIDDVINALQEECGARVLSGDRYAPMPHDIDILIEPPHARRAREILHSFGFVLGASVGGKIEAQRFVDGALFFIDIAYSFAYLARLFPDAHFSGKFAALVREDPQAEKFIHYLYLVRSGEKYTRFVEEAFPRYRGLLFDRSYVGTPVFRRSLTADTAVKLMRKNSLALIRGLTVPALLSFFVQHIRLRIQRLGSGQIVTIIGPDGSGKTSVITTLSRYMDLRVLYMGDWGFRFQPFYDLLQRGPLWVARLSYPFFYVENWFRIIRAYALKALGHTVLLDRYPGLNRHMAKSETLMRLNMLMYAAFPGADRYVLLSAPPSVIHARKQELSEDEIARSQENMRRALQRKGDRFIEIENVDFDACLNQVLEVLTED